MGLTKQYLRYVASAVFGLIGSQKGNIVFVTLRGEKGRYVAVPACEHVFIWDLRKGEKILILQGNKQEVTCLCPSPDGLHLAVGYEDGAIRIFSLLSGEGNITFNGHKAAVTSLKYDQLGGRLASGSKDTDVIIWDVIKECPGIQDTPESEDSTLEADDEKSEDRILSCSKAGSIMREGRDRVVNLAVDKTGRILACHGTDSVLEVFCILSKAEVQKKMDKKLKKARKKKRKNRKRMILTLT